MVLNFSSNYDRAMLLGAIILGTYSGYCWAACSCDSRLQCDPLQQKLVFGMFAINGGVWCWVLKQGKKVSTAILHQSSRRVGLREAMRGSWTNSSVISALLLGVTVSIWLDDHPSGGHDKVWDVLFFLLMLNATFWSATAMISATFCLMFTDSLSNDALKKFLAEMPGLLGQSVLFVMVALVCTSLAFIVWAYTHYSLTVAVGTSGLVLTVTFYVTFVYFDLAQFRNTVDKFGRRGRDTKWLGWNSDSVRDWLQKDERFTEYADNFAEQNITGKHLPHLTEDLLEKIGVQKMGDRFELLDAIHDLCVFVDRPPDVKSLLSRTFTVAGDTFSSAPPSKRPRVGT